jgi:hypothetical protein
MRILAGILIYLAALVFVCRFVHVATRRDDE